GLVEHAALAHFTPEVVALAGALAHAGEDGIAAVFGSDVVDQFLDQHRLAHARAAEQADLAAAGVGGQQVDDLDAGLEDLGIGVLFLKGRRVAVDGPLFGGLHRAFFVDGFAQHVEHTAQRGLAHRRLDRVAGGDDLVAARKALARREQDAAHRMAADVAGNLHGAAAVRLLDEQFLIDLRQGALAELYVNDRAQHLRDHTFVLHNSLSFLVARRSPGFVPGVPVAPIVVTALRAGHDLGDRKSTRLNSSHVSISYAVFCLKKKNRA